MGQARLVKAIGEYLLQCKVSPDRLHGDFHFKVDQPCNDYIHIAHRGSTWLTAAFNEGMGVWRICYAKEAAAIATAQRLDMESYAALLFENRVQELIQKQEVLYVQA